jgi:hypothetical protein
MAVALLALFVALTGTAAAGSGLITGGQIKDHSIGMIDLSNTAVTRLHGAHGATGLDGAQGQTGATGLTGLTGAVGLNGGLDPNKISYQTSVPIPLVVGQIAVMTATCPAGAKVVGGGGFVNIGKMSESEANGTGAWTVIAYNDTLVTLSGAVAFAVCVSP